MLKYYDSRPLDANCPLTPSSFNSRVYIPTSYIHQLGYLKKDMPVWVKTENEDHYEVYILTQDLTETQFEIVLEELLTRQ